MDWLIGILICGLVVFSVGSAIREIRLYRRAVRGEIQYLVSRPRRNRRLIVSLLLLIEAGLLHLGSFVLIFRSPSVALFYWVPPLLLMMIVIVLGFRDLRETRRDIDRIFHEAARSALKSVDRAKKS
jgi:hypothetical protein